jgi:hypothetical protein
MNTPAAGKSEEKIDPSSVMVRPAGTTAVSQAGQRPGIEHSTTTITPSGAAGAPARSAAAAKGVAQTTNDPLEIARRARLDSLSNALDSALKEQPLNHRLVQHIAQSLQHEADVLKQEVQELGDQLRASAGKRPHLTSFASAAHPPGAHRIRTTHRIRLRQLSDDGRR